MCRPAEPALLRPVLAAYCGLLHLRRWIGRSQMGGGSRALEKAVLEDWRRGLRLRRPRSCGGARLEVRSHLGQWPGPAGQA